MVSSHYMIKWNDRTASPQYLWHLVRGNCAIYMSNYFKKLFKTGPMTSDIVYNE